MGPKQAIRNGLTGSFRFSGRIGRSEFWWFMPLGLVPPVAVASRLDWNVIELYGIWRVIAVMGASLPLLAAMSRRLQDMGEPGHHAFYPFMPLILLWLGYQAMMYFSIGSISVGFLPAIILLIAGLLFFMPLYLFAQLASLVLAGSVIGMLLVPSDRTANPYGPNPDEVNP